MSDKWQAWAREVAPGASCRAAARAARLASAPCRSDALNLLINVESETTEDKDDSPEAGRRGLRTADPPPTPDGATEEPPTVAPKGGGRGFWPRTPFARLLRKLFRPICRTHRGGP